MSDTPRTDAVAGGYGDAAYLQWDDDPNGSDVPVDFAKTIERELAETKRQLEGKIEWIDLLQQKLGEEQEFAQALGEKLQASQAENAKLRDIGDRVINGLCISAFT